MRTITRLLTVLLLLAACAKGAPSQTKDKATSDAANKTCPVTRHVLSDGTIEIQNKDCTITKLPKKQNAVPPVEVTAPDENAQAAPGNLEKLREMKPQAPPAGEADATMREKYVAAMDAYFDYYTAGYLHRQRVFEWQLVSSRIIFVLVALLVLSGVYFAAIQFHTGLRRPLGTIATASAGDEKVVAPQAVTTFSASAKGIEVSSPVLGVIILVISLAFFYLYLVYVYPVTELF